MVHKKIGSRLAVFLITALIMVVGSGVVQDQKAAANGNGLPQEAYDQLNYGVCENPYTRWAVWITYDTATFDAAGNGQVRLHGAYHPCSAAPYRVRDGRFYNISASISGGAITSAVPNQFAIAPGTDATWTNAGQYSDNSWTTINVRIAPGSCATVRFNFSYEAYHNSTRNGYDGVVTADSPAICAPIRNSPPTGSLSISCASDGSGRVYGSWNDPNGATSAYVIAGSQKSTQNGSSFTWSTTVAEGSSGTWSAHLYVADVGGSGYRLVASQSRAACPRPGMVQGYIVENSCGGNAVHVGATVSNGTNSATPGAGPPLQPFYVPTSPGSRTISISGVNANYDVIGYCWNYVSGNPAMSGVTAGSSASFTRTLASGATVDMRWVVRAKPASLDGYIVRQGDGAAMAGLVNILGVACEGTTTATDAPCAPYPGGSHNANRAFFFTNMIPTGDRTLEVQYIESGYRVVGSKICINGGRTQSGVPACNTAWNNTATTPSGSGYAVGSSRTFNFLANASYSMRWIVRPDAPSCGSLTTNPPILDIATTSFSVEASFAYANNSVAQYVHSDTARYRTFIRNSAGTQIASPAGVPVGGVQSGSGGVTTRVNGSSIIMTYTFNGSFPSSGNYNIVYNMTNDARGVTGINDVVGGNCVLPVLIGNKPVFTVLGGDTIAGLRTVRNNGICDARNAGVAAWNQGSSTYIGSGSRLGVMALAAIQGFATRTGTAGTSEPVQSLHFANRDASGALRTHSVNSVWGGSFGNYQTDCITRDFFAYKPTAATTLTGTLPSLTARSGSLQRTGDVRIAASQINEGQRTVLYVDGNVTITDNITFNGGSVAGNYPNRAAIPSLWIIATGDIFVQPNVSTLEGVFVAQGKQTGANSTGGRFFTCASGTADINRFGGSADGSAVTNATVGTDYYTRCNRALTVNGSVIAQRMVLNRSYGSINNGQVAEVFNYNPLVWLAPSPFNDSGESDGARLGDAYDAITSLPPVL